MLASARPGHLALLFGLAAVIGACDRDASAPGAGRQDEAPRAGDPASPPADADSFAAYWHGGLAELTSYQLTQASHGALREGTATLIYAIEPFSRRRHVSVDDAARAGDDALPTLTFNAAREFVTGIDPFTMMTSVFTPVAGARALKVTTSSQEWGGHTFTQINRGSRGWRLRAFSYVESDADRSLALPDVWLEDEVWTALRLDPAALPTGELRMLPGTIYQRLSHTDFEPQRVVASIMPDSTDETLRVYSVEYPRLRRTLRISFRADFPHEVETWQETYPDGDQLLTTHARATGRQRLGYNTLINPDDEVRHDSLRVGTQPLAAGRP